MSANTSSPLSFKPPSRVSTLEYRRAQDDDDVEPENDEEFLFEDHLATPGLGDDDVKTLFEQHLQEARDLRCLSSDQKKERDDFAERRQSQWDKKTQQERRNFLHVLAYYDFTRKPSLNWLMSRAIARLAKFMGELDSSNRTPLHVAIELGNNMFVHAVCKNVKDNTRRKIGEALLSECREQESGRKTSTSLHAALTSVVLNPDHIKTIIGFVPEHMFQVKDNNGYTPLHLAVDYKVYRSLRVDIVTELLRRGPRALDALMSGTPDNTYSVYQYHEKTLQEVEKMIEKRSQAQPLHGLEGGRRIDKNEPDSSGRGEEEWVRRGGLHGFRENLGREESHGTGRRGSVAPTPQEYKPNTPIQKTKMSQLAAPNFEAELQRQQDAADLKDLRDGAERIREMLKLEYLRRKGPHEVAQFLHVQDEKVHKELWFDFGPKPKSGPGSKITSAQFIKHFDHLEFDPILQYVAFPDVEVELRKRGSHESQTDAQQQGRQDMVFFFNWLRKKKVQRIIKVIVDDLGSSPHSDEAIEKALKDFHVEVLDWRRLDLCPSTISSIGSDLREVHLQWSGRNAVLHAWSEPEGLALTPTLRNIHIHQADEILYCPCQHHGKSCSGVAMQGSLNSTERTKKNLDDFEARLSKWWPTKDDNNEDGKDNGSNKDITKHNNNKQHLPKIHRPPTINASRHRAAVSPVESQPAHRIEPDLDANRWMRCMEEFADTFKQIRLKDLSSTHTPESLTPITVALIDDGADIRHPELNGKKFPGKSFHYYKDTSNSWRVSPYWDSASGHGTLMARLIHRICPTAIIYVIKLQTFTPSSSSSTTGNPPSSSPSKKLQITTSSALAALSHAIDSAACSASLISLSWTIARPTSPADRDAFDTLLKRASARRIPIFCSAPDQGKFADTGTYPHGALSGPSTTFRIGAAKDSGGIAGFAGGVDKVDFVFPGKEVVLERGEYEDLVGDGLGGLEGGIREFPGHTGSSVATALAAGLAGVVLECVRLGMVYSGEMKWRGGGGVGDSQVAAAAAAAAAYHHHLLEASIAIGREDWEVIRERQGMETALKGISVSGMGDQKYIEVWGTFRGKAAELRGHEGVLMEQLAVVAGLARHFLRKGAVSSVGVGGKGR